MAAAGLEADAFQRLYPEEFFLRFVSEGVRPDGRPLGRARPTVINLGAAPTTEGSALVKIGNTTMLVGIKLEVMVPSTEAPTVGKLVLQFEMPPLCSPNLRPGRPVEEAAAVTEQVTNAIHSSNLVDLTELCIAPGKAAWMAYMDIYCLDADGSLLDAALLAAVAALSHLQLPAVTVTEEGKVVPTSSAAEDADNAGESAEDNGVAGRSLTLGPVPYALTSGLYKEHLIADPTAEEEHLLESTVTVVMDPGGRLIAFYKPGGTAAIDTPRIQDFIELARLRVRELQKLLTGALEATAEEDEDMEEEEA